MGPNMKPRIIKKKTSQLKRRAMLKVNSIVLSQLIHQALDAGDHTEVSSIIARSKEVLKAIQTIPGMKKRLIPITRFDTWIGTCIQHRLTDRSFKVI